MTRWTGRLAPIACALLAGPLAAQAPPAGSLQPLPDLSEFRTVVTAVTAAPSKSAAGLPISQPGYLGVSLDAGAAGQLVVSAVEPRSPAELAGVKPGDVVR